MHKYKTGDWICFAGYRSAGSLNENALIITEIAYPTNTLCSAYKPAYVTKCGRLVDEDKIFEVRPKEPAK